MGFFHTNVKIHDPYFKKFKQSANIIKKIWIAFSRLLDSIDESKTLKKNIWEIYI